MNRGIIDKLILSEDVEDNFLGIYLIKEEKGEMYAEVLRQIIHEIGNDIWINALGTTLIYKYFLGRFSPQSYNIRTNYRNLLCPRWRI